MVSTIVAKLNDKVYRKWIEETRSRLTEGDLPKVKVVTLLDVKGSSRSIDLRCVS